MENWVWPLFSRLLPGWLTVEEMTQLECNSVCLHGSVSTAYLWVPHNSERKSNSSIMELIREMNAELEITFDIPNKLFSRSLTKQLFIIYLYNLLLIQTSTDIYSVQCSISILSVVYWSFKVYFCKIPMAVYIGSTTI